MSTPTSRRLAIALAVSVGLNLFLAGMIASAWIAKRHYADRPDRPAAALAGGFDFRRGLAALGDEARPIAREIRRDFAPRLRESGREVRAARQDVGALLLREDLDPAALQDAFGELRQATDNAQATMHEALIETMTRLDTDQRRAFLEAAMRGRPGERRPPRDEGG
ncbi:MAG: periplasmic heavy metal sensor [Rhodospirillales bacterium]|nr:MAG: periplasmic heavy metal sensor [Rhodospirillales bacterium]